MEINSQSSHDETLTNSHSPQTTEDTSAQFPNLNKFANKKFIIIATIIVVIIIALGITFFITRRNGAQEQATTEPELEMIDPATLTDADKREINQAVAEGHLNYLAGLKDSRGVYLDYAITSSCEESGSICQNIGSNRAFLPAIWARYQYYLLTEDAAQLQILKDDIQQAQTAILDGYTEDGGRYVIQNNSFNCYLMKPIIEDEKGVLTAWEKDTLKRFCVESSYEWLSQEEITFIIEEDLTKQDKIIPSGAVEKAILLQEINSKIDLINNNQVESFNYQEDIIYRSFMENIRASLTEDQTQYADEFFRELIKGYYYFAFDQLARYQIEPNNDNDYLSLVLINDFLSIYLYSQQQTEPIFGDNLDNCFVQPLIAQAKQILPEGAEITALQAINYEPNFDIGAALSDDMNRHPNLSCWLVQFENNNLDQTEINQFQNATFEYFGNNTISNSIVKSSLLTGLLSQSLRN